MPSRQWCFGLLMALYSIDPESFIMSKKEQLPNEPKCPNCSRLIDGYTQIDLKDVEIEVGDYSICLYCGFGMKYRGEGIFDKIEEEELIVVRSRYAGFRKAEEAVRRLLHENKKNRTRT